jgi:hypothetical protein
MFGSIFLSRIFRGSLTLLAFSACFLLLLPPVTEAAQVSLAWNPSASINVAGYRVYYGTASRSYQFTNDAGNSTTTTISNLQEGTPYYFSVTAYDPTGVESSYSNEVAYNPGPICTYSVTPSSQSAGSAGGAGTVNVSSQSGCTWAAVSNVSWVVITSNGGGTGSGPVNYSVSANASSSSRTGTLTVAGKTFTITQAGASQYTLSITKIGTGTGTITSSPTGTTFNAGTVVALTAAPNASSTFSGWSGGCTGTSPTCSLTVNTNTAITASFALKTSAITASAGPNGSISPQGTVTINYGSTQRFTITPNSGYQVADVKVDGYSAGAVPSYTFANVTTNHTIQASFILAPSNTVSDAIKTYVITASAGTNGSISPSGPVTVNYGGSQSFTIVANRGYKIANVSVDGVSVGKAGTYQFGNIQADHRIEVSFSPAGRGRKKALNQEDQGQKWSFRTRD